MLLAFILSCSSKSSLACFSCHISGSTLPWMIAGVLGHEAINIHVSVSWIGNNWHSKKLWPTTFGKQGHNGIDEVDQGNGVEQWAYHMSCTAQIVVFPGSMFVIQAIFIALAQAVMEFFFEALKKAWVKVGSWGSVTLICFKCCRKQSSHKFQPFWPCHLLWRIQ